MRQHKSQHQHSIHYSVYSSPFFFPSPQSTAEVKKQLSIMESHGNLPPFIPNPWDPPLPPPPNFQWGNSAFSGDVFPQFHPYHSPSDHSFVAGAGNFCPPKPNFPRKRKFGKFLPSFRFNVLNTLLQFDFCSFVSNKLFLFQINHVYNLAY